MNYRSLLSLVLFAFAPTACNLAPQYSRPEPPIPHHWPDHPTTRPTTQPANPPLLEWQEFFVDTNLQTIIHHCLKNNRDLRLAALNVQRAQQMFGVQRSQLLPVLNGIANYNRQRVPAGLSRSPEPITSSVYTLDLRLAEWELDLFGRIRNLADSALFQFLATEQARRGVQITLVSNIANTYLALAADREGLQLAQDTLQTQLAAYDLVKKRFERGVVPEIDLFRAQSQVEVARGDVARFTQLVALDENALTLLAGSPVPRELLPPNLSQLSPLTELAPGLPSDVLLLRPDILQAENQLQAAYANIGAARANLFPRISLTSAGGLASVELSSLFNASSRAWTFSPQVVMPVFDARAWSALQVTKVDRQIALTQYEKAIQAAFREVADALAVRSTVNQQLSALESYVHAVAETYRLSNARYDKGLDSYLSVLDAQRSLYFAQHQLVSLRLAKLANQVRLYAVLGGGWNPPPDPTQQTPAQTRPAQP